MCKEGGKEEQARGWLSSISAISGNESRARFKLRNTNPISIIPITELAYFTTVSSLCFDGLCTVVVVGWYRSIGKLYKGLNFW